MRDIKREKVKISLTSSSPILGAGFLAFYNLTKCNILSARVEIITFNFWFVIRKKMRQTSLDPYLNK
jgi:hypothetical protein